MQAGSSCAHAACRLPCLQVHACSGHQLADVDAHGGSRIWSIAHSRLRPHLTATASDDRTVKLWAGRGLVACAATIAAPSGVPVCCVDFSTTHEHLLALVRHRRCAMPVLCGAGGGGASAWWLRALHRTVSRRSNAGWSVSRRYYAGTPCGVAPQPPGRPLPP